MTKRKSFVRDTISSYCNLDLTSNVQLNQAQYPVVSHPWCTYAVLQFFMRLPWSSHSLFLPTVPCCEWCVVVFPAIFTLYSAKLRISIGEMSEATP